MPQYSVEAHGDVVKGSLCGFALVTNTLISGGAMLPIH